MATDLVAGMTLTAMDAESVARCRSVAESGSVEYLFRIGALSLALMFSASPPAAMFGMAYPRDPARYAASHEAAVS
ncbi:hypothetical protein FPJ27_13795 [Burkholderia sp. MS455]|uniref:hypothetical protein n=1 Tax=Burkholderia sp. MS455 TaxID=2811788 RepID=UPI00195EE01F|nr:hypothetical protein [Burkholderia sp. MS455]QRR07394.1 hypothetical protein FPJ27_13795 [Burkholderia sp. MS455]